MNTSITALELVENKLDIKSQDSSGHEAGDELDEEESAEISDDDAGDYSFVPSQNPARAGAPGRPRKTAQKAE